MWEVWVVKGVVVVVDRPAFGFVVKKGFGFVMVEMGSKRHVQQQQQRCVKPVGRSIGKTARSKKRHATRATARTHARTHLVP